VTLERAREGWLGVVAEAPGELGDAHTLAAQDLARAGDASLLPLARALRSAGYNTELDPVLVCSLSLRVASFRQRQRQQERQRQRQRQQER